MQNKFQITSTGRDYCYPTNSKATTAKGIIKAFDFDSNTVYEINNKQYYGHELTTEQKIECLIKDGFIV